MRDILICEASAAVNLIVSEIDNLLGKNQLDAYSSDSSDESEDSDTGMNRTVDLRKTKNILKNNEPKIREKFKDTSNLNKTSKITTKKMLDQIHNPVITKSALLHSNKIIRVSNSEYNGPYMHKRETDTSTNYSVK